MCSIDNFDGQIEWPLGLNGWMHSVNCGINFVPGINWMPFSKRIISRLKKLAVRTKICSLLLFSRSLSGNFCNRTFQLENLTDSSGRKTRASRNYTNNNKKTYPICRQSASEMYVCIRVLLCGITRMRPLIICLCEMPVRFFSILFASVCVLVCCAQS